MKLKTALAAPGLLAFCLAFGAQAAPAPSVDGRWVGPVVLPNGTNYLAIFHVVTQGGKTTVVYDSPTYEETAVPATVTRAGDKVTLTVPADSISFTGTFSADGQSLVGELNQGGGIAHVTLVQKPAPVAQVMTGPAVAGLDGRWEGQIMAPDGALRVVLRFSTTGDKTTTFLDSPEQDVVDIPAVAGREGQTVTVTVPSVGGKYVAVLSDDGKTLTGDWTQRGPPKKLVMVRK